MIKPSSKTHERSYILCATARSGTTLLCDLLTDTGVSGKPNSYFREQDLLYWADMFGVPIAGWRNDRDFDPAYLAAVLEHGTAGTGTFGLRLMWESRAHLMARLDDFHPGRASDDARLRAAFGQPIYIHVSRRDKLAQAVSLLKAQQTGLWHRHSDGSERERLRPARPSEYDPNTLSERIRELEEHDNAWRLWFAEQGIEPVSVIYEDLAADPQATVAAILSALGHDPAIAERVVPRTAKLADGESMDWVVRFRAGS